MAQLTAVVERLGAGQRTATRLLEGVFGAQPVSARQP